MNRSIALMIGLALVPDLARADITPPRDTRSPRVTEEALLKQWRQGRGASMRDMLEKFGPTALLYAPAVLDALGLTDEQIAQVQATQKAFSQKALVVGMSCIGVTLSSFGITLPGPDGPRTVEDARKRVEDIRKSRKAQSTAAQAVHQRGAEALVQLLDVDQRRRLWQIALLVEGPLVLAWPSPPPPDELGLTPAQEARIREIRDTFSTTKKEYELAQNEILFVPQGGPGVYLSSEKLRQQIQDKGFTWMTEQVDMARVRANQQVTDLLTADQRRKLDGLGLIPDDVSDLIRPGGGQWRPAEAKRYWEEHKARKAREQVEAGEKK